MRLGPLGYHDTFILAPPAGLGAEAPTRFYTYLPDLRI